MVLRGILTYANWNAYLKQQLTAYMKSVLRHWASYLNPFWEPDAIIIVSSLFQPMILMSDKNNASWILQWTDWLE